VGGAAYIFATIGAPGLIEHTGGPARLVVGEMSGGSSARVGRLVEAFRAAGVDIDESPDIRAVLWSKFSFICAQAGVTSASRLPIGEILASPAGRDLFRSISAEVCAVAAAEGVVLAPDLPDKNLRFAEQLEPDSTSSLYHDLVHGHRLELDALLGEVVRRGENHGLDVSASRVLYAVLAPSAARNLGLSARGATI
jgi:2-dehydropantoate 2-reductase